MRKQIKNYAFIDSQNLNLGIRQLGWNLDFGRFRVYLKEKYGVTRAYLFLGYVKKNKDMHESLRISGYYLIFKPTIKDNNGCVKGNVDAELVLQAMIDYNKYNKAIIVSGDGDFYCLVKYLRKQGKLEKLLAPNYSNCSTLLKRNLVPIKEIIFMNNLYRFLKYKTP